MVQLVVTYELMDCINLPTLFPPDLLHSTPPIAPLLIFYTITCLLIQPSATNMWPFLPTSTTTCLHPNFHHHSIPFLFSNICQTTPLRFPCLNFHLLESKQHIQARSQCLVCRWLWGRLWQWDDGGLMADGMFWVMCQCLMDFGLSDNMLWNGLNWIFPSPYCNVETHLNSIPSLFSMQVFRIYKNEAATWMHVTELLIWISCFSLNP